MSAGEGQSAVTGREGELNDWLAWLAGWLTARVATQLRGCQRLAACLRLMVAF